MIPRLLNSILTIALFCCACQMFAQQGNYQEIQQNEFEQISEPLYQITKEVNNKTLSNEISKSLLKDKQFYKLEQLNQFSSSETANYAVTTPCAIVDINILFDGFPGQSSWDIIDSNSNIVASGGSYGYQSGYSIYSTQAACLPDGCYTLNFYDALANGMCPFQSSA